MALVLCTGADPVLLETRKLILEEAGHIVISARDHRTVMAACKHRIFDVAVIGQSVSPDNKRLLAALVRRHCRSTQILELHYIYEGRAVEDADSWLEVPVDVPQDLAERVADLARSKPRRWVSALSFRAQR